MSEIDVFEKLDRVRDGQEVNKPSKENGLRLLAQLDGFIRKMFTILVITSTYT